ncbi:uncharacterized protein [Anas acuta]|uniref:uncharacterized protein n=1 Tax=Anas acuta TaxID=28680 RepID=UPI0035C90C6C
MVLVKTSSSGCGGIGSDLPGQALPDREPKFSAWAGAWAPCAPRAAGNEAGRGGPARSPGHGRGRPPLPGVPARTNPGAEPSGSGRGAGPRGRAVPSGAHPPRGPCRAVPSRVQPPRRCRAEPCRAEPCILAALQQAPGPGHCLFLPEEGPSPALHNVLFQARLPAPPARCARPPRPRSPSPAASAPLRPRPPGPPLSLSPPPPLPSPPPLLLAPQRRPLSPGSSWLSASPERRQPGPPPSVPPSLPAPSTEPRRRAGAGRQGPGPAPEELHAHCLTLDRSVP